MIHVSPNNAIPKYLSIDYELIQQVMKKTEQILLGIFGVFAAGVLAGTLYAPDKGERLRKRILRKGRWFLHSASDTFAEAKEKLEDIKDGLKDKIEKISGEMDRLSSCQTQKYRFPKERQ